MNIEKQYLSLLEKILKEGIEKKDRTGTGTKSIFGVMLEHDMKEGFPLLTTKKMAWKQIVVELLWFLRGETNIKYLVENDCHIWDGDCYKNYCKSHTSPPSNPGGPLLSDNLISIRPIQYTKEEFINKIKTDDEFAKKWGDLGPIYGKQWRKWNKVRFRDIQRVNQHPTQIMGIENPFEEEGKWVRGYEDQIANLIRDLKTNPDSRRLMVNAWNVSEISETTLPPCHYGFQIYTRELSLEERASLWNNTHSPAGNIYTHTQYDENEIPKRAISLMFTMRSNDVPLGLPFNIASYGLLLEIIGKMVNMVPDKLIASLGDAHIYNNQIDGVKEQLSRNLYNLPTLSISNDVNFNGSIDDFLNSCTKDSFMINEYKSHPAIKMPLSN